MKVFIFTFVAIASVFISSANGFYTGSQTTACVCPAPTVVEKPVYYCPQTNPPTSGGNYPPPNGGYYPPTNGGSQVKNCYYGPCNLYPTLPAACGNLNGQCKMYTCVHDLFNENCSNDSKIESVSLKYCQGMSIGGGFLPCATL